VHALPYLVLVAMIAGLSWYQQKQIMGRNPSAEVTQQQQLMMRIGPLMYVFFAFISPAAIGVYFLVSTLWRVGQQAFITRSLYGSEDSVGVQAQKAMAEVRAAKKTTPSKNGTGNGAKADKADKAAPAGKAAAGATRGNGARSGGAGAKASAGSRAAATSAAASSPGAKPHPRSRKKKKRK
jgi:uncharacterized membrane protein YgcG